MPKDIFKKGSGYNEETQFFITPNKTYVVYGMTLYSGYVWYYICDEAYLYYPCWNPSPLFEVVDGRLSQYWIFSFEKGNDQQSTYTTWAYKEWANDPYYYDSLTDGDEAAVEIFKKYKNLMDLEFSDPDVQISAMTTGDDKWLICPKCLEAWQSDSCAALIQCPSCATVLNNPFYKQN